MDLVEIRYFQNSYHRGFVSLGLELQRGFRRPDKSMRNSDSRLLHDI